MSGGDAGAGGAALLGGGGVSDGLVGWNIVSHDDALTAGPGRETPGLSHGHGSEHESGAGSGGADGRVSSGQLRGVPEVYVAYCAAQALAVRHPASGGAREGGTGSQWKQAHER